MRWRTSNQPIEASAADAQLTLQLFTAVLSLTAGSLDVITFLGFGGLFAAHITGNLVILAAHFAGSGVTELAAMLSVPVFMLVLILTRIMASGLQARGYNALRPLLLLQTILLAAFLGLATANSAAADMAPTVATLGGMLGVAAMAVQNALGQISLKEAPATAVMTTNIVRFTMDIGTVLLRADRDEIAKARDRANKTWPSIAGFVVGCALGAACEARFDLRSLVLPTVLSLTGLVMAGAFPPASPVCQPVTCGRGVPKWRAGVCGAARHVRR
jgi:uncharacterized membrane protein YoaK (UPF0700 family)